MKKGDRVKLTRDLPLVMERSATGTVLVAGSVGYVLETGHNSGGNALALVSFPVLDHARIVVDCAWLRVVR